MNRTTKKTTDRKNLLFVIFAMILAFAVITGILVSATVRISAKEEQPKKDCYKSIEIEPNDTLWSISEAYASDYGMTVSSYVKKLKEINGLSSETIISGQYLVVVYASN